MKRLYNAVCAWLEADAEARGFEGEPVPEGNNFAMIEREHRGDAELDLHSQVRRIGFGNDPECGL